jgi:3-hydroxybutyryl-CoA dehydrogenase
MGSGIASVILAAGHRVTLVESSDDLSETARARVRRSTKIAAERGTLATSADEVMSRLTNSTDYGYLRACAAVVEAVPEILALKSAVLGRIEKAVDVGILIGSNTSSLSIEALANTLSRPDRFLGLHFFNPVPVSLLVEIVKGAATNPATVAKGHALAALLGKESIEVNDSPGFASSRLGVALGLEAIRMVAEQVASPEDIDKAMTLGYRHPIGPLRLTDLVGLDVRLSIAEYLFGELGPRYEPPALLRTMVADGKLGKKTGEGFYRWT